jgi:hypothetical protein
MEPEEIWTRWTLAEIIEYADEVAESVSLEPELRPALRQAMWQRAGYWEHIDAQGPQPRVATYPRMPRFMIDARSWMSGDEWLEQCRRLNEPREPRAYKYDDAGWELPRPKWELRGDGLTARHILVSDHPFATERGRSFMRAPFTHEAGRQNNMARDMLWRAGYLCVGYSHDWIGPKGMNEPFSGLLWYYDRINRWRRAAAHFSMKVSFASTQRAMFCALKAGECFAEMALRATHNDFFLKQKLIHDRQKSYAESTRKGGDEERRAAWWKYRRQGYSSIKAADMAGDELGVSNRTIRRAFKDELPEWDGAR